MDRVWGYPNPMGQTKGLGVFVFPKAETRMGLELEDNDVSSSSEEDGDEQWKAAIKAVTSTFIGFPTPSKPTLNNPIDEDDANTQLPKHYQIKAQKVLDDILEKSLVMVKDPDSVNNYGYNPQVNDGGVRLFKQAPVGIVFDHRDEPKGPRKKPRILPGEEIDVKSKKFKRRMKSVAVEGSDILASAKYACQKSLAKFEAKEAAVRDAAKREEERVAQLKKIRGERWLPSMAREMHVKPQGHFIGSK